MSPLAWQLPALTARRCLIHEPEVTPMFQNLPPDDSDYKKVIKSLHTKSVEATIQSYIPSKVLNSRPPEINPSESSLSRKERSRLAQLRSGYSPILQSYCNTIDNSVPDRCPLCNQTPHNTLHLFNCRANPTELNVNDLWTKPVQVAAFLNLDEPD